MEGRAVIRIEVVTKRHAVPHSRTQARLDRHVPRTRRDVVVYAGGQNEISPLVTSGVTVQ